MDDEPAPQHIRAIRDLSWAIFRRHYALEIGAVIDGLEVFNIGEVADRLEPPPSASSLQKELSDLRGIGLIHEAPKRRSERQKFYGKTVCGYWSSCVSLPEWRQEASWVRLGVYRQLVPSFRLIAGP